MTDQEEEERPAPKKGRTLQNLVTYPAAVIALGFESQGMYHAIKSELEITDPTLLVAFFSVFTLAIVASTMRARRNMIERGKAGLDGVILFGLAAVSGTIATMAEKTDGGHLARIVVPLVAAIMLERAIAAERQDVQKAKGRKDVRHWKKPLDWVAIRLGLGRSDNSTVAERIQQRRLDQIARLGYLIHSDPTSKAAQRARQKLPVKVAGLDRDDRAAVRERLATMFQAVAQTTPDAVAVLSPWTEEEIPSREIPTQEIPEDVIDREFRELSDPWKFAAPLTIVRDETPGDEDSRPTLTVKSQERTGNGRSYRDPVAVRNAYEELRAKEPDLTKQDIATRLGYADPSGLRYALSKTEPKEDQK